MASAAVVDLTAQAEQQQADPAVELVLPLYRPRHCLRS
jgi:hypothetical protein